MPPIVSPSKSAVVICKMWDRKYHTAPDMVVIEGPLAGGHLGFTRDQLSALGADTDDVPDTYKQSEYDEEIKKIVAVVREYEEKYQKKIPIVTAGGIYTHEDVMRQIDELGMDGVQVATRFVTTEECDAPRAYKEAYINASVDDIVITQSPVGMPGRAIKNTFLQGVGKVPFKLEHCYKCLEKCDPAKIPYCITKALVNAAEGDVDNALVFCGANAYRATKIETVPEVMKDLLGE